MIDESQIPPQFRGAPISLACFAPDGRLEYLNPAFIRRFGTGATPPASAAALFELLFPSAADLRRLLDWWKSLLPPDPSATLSTVSATAALSGHPTEIQLHATPAGTRIIVAFLDPAEGPPAAQLLNALLVSPPQQPIDLMLDALNAGACQWLAGSDTLELDERLRDLLGFGNHEPVSLKECLSRVHPADRENLERHLEEASRSPVGTPWKHEFRIHHPQRGERWISSAGRVTRQPDGGVALSGVKQDITVLRRTSDSLAEVERKFQLLHETMTDGFAIVDMDGKYRESNSSFRQILGYSHEELQQLTYRDITPERWHAMETSVLLDEVLPHGYSAVYEKEYRRKDGSIVPVELRAQLITSPDGEPSGVWAIVRDISARQKASQSMLEMNADLEILVARRTRQLQHSEQRYRQLADASFEALVVTENGIVLDGNQQLADFYHCTLDELIGQPVLQFVAPESRANVTKRIRRGIEGAYEFMAMRPDGTYFPAEANARMSTWMDKSTRVSAIRDLTREKDHNARIETLSAELEQSQRLAVLSEISAGIIHQISQPISTIGMKLMLANSGHDSCAGGHCHSFDALREIQSEFDRIRTIMTHLKSLAHPDQPQRTPIDLNEVALESARMVKADVHRRDILLKIDLDESVPPISADAVQLTQVIINLLRNAFDACESMPPDHRIVALSSKHITNHGVQIQVEDSGPGLPSVGGRLFSPFFTTKPDGAGIGLRLSRTIIHAHGGSIDGTNRSDGKGARFTVFLPTSDMPPVS